MFLLFISRPGAASPQGTRVPELSSVLVTGVTAKINSLFFSMLGGAESLKFIQKGFKFRRSLLSSMISYYVLSMNMGAVGHLNMSDK